MTTQVAKRHRSKPTDPRQSNFLALLLREAGPELVPLPSEAAPTIRGFSEDQRIRRLLTEALRASDRSREELAAAMSLGDEPVSAAMLNSWTGPARANAAPLKHLKAMLRAIGPRAAFELLNELLAGTGFIALDEVWARYAQIGQLTAVAAAAHTEAARLATAQPPKWGRQ